MSQFVQSLPAHPLTYEAREMACHFADAYAQRLLGELSVCLCVIVDLCSHRLPVCDSRPLQSVCLCVIVDLCSHHLPVCDSRPLQSVCLCVIVDLCSHHLPVCDSRPLQSPSACV